MYPKLHDMINDLFGTSIQTPIQTFGFFMALGFVAGTLWLTYAFKFKERKGIFKSYEKETTIGEPASLVEIITNAIVGFLIGFKLLPAITNYSDLVSNPQAFLMSTQGSLVGGIVLAVALAGWKYYSAEKAKLPKPKKVKETVRPHQMVGDIIGVAAITGVLGSKLLSILESFDEFLLDPVGMLLSFSGLTFYGGLIAGFIGVAWYVRKHKNSINFIHMLDVAAPALIIGYAIGRLGCHFSGDGDWGAPNLLANPGLPDWLWAYDYPNNVLGRGIPVTLEDGSVIKKLAEPVWPTPVYENIMGTGIFAFLAFLFHKITVPGILFSIYLMINGLERFLIEFVRVNERYAFNFSLSQFIALGLIAAGAISFAFFWRRFKN